MNDDIWDKDNIIDMGGGIKLNKAFASPDHCPKCGAPRGMLYEIPEYTDAYTCQSYWFYYEKVRFDQSEGCKCLEKRNLIIDIENGVMSNDLITRILKFLKED